MKTYTSRMIMLGLGTAIFLSAPSFANDKPRVLPTAVEPTSCITSTFSTSGSYHHKRITLTLKNNCNSTVDFQNSTVTFLNRYPLNTEFWGDFWPLSYPIGERQITSQPNGDNYLSSLNLRFSTDADANTKLPAGRSIYIKYRARRDGHIGSANVYLNNTVTTGNIALKNASAKPTDVSQDYAVVHVTANGTNVSDVQLPWNDAKTVTGLAAGNYNLTADTIDGSNDNRYQGVANPANVTVADNQTVNSIVTYTAVQLDAKLAIQLQALPDELTGYTGKPSVRVTQADTNTSVQADVNWGAATTVSQLKNAATYHFSTPVISFNNHTCQPAFNPATLVANATTVLVTQLTYACKQATQATATLNVTGAPTTLGSLKITLTPNNATAPVTQTVTLTNGAGSSTVGLAAGTAYTVTADPVEGYAINFNPQPLTAANGAIETITLTQQGSGTPVAVNGQLSVCGTQLCNQHGQPVQLKGMSSHGIQWYGWQGSNTEKACLTTASLDTLASAWKANVIRISMYVQEDGYETDPDGFTKQVNQLIDEATKRGIYAIVDWHMLEPGDPNYNLARAKTFFTAIATAHKNNNNLLYEIANEPSGVPWSSIKSYAEALIPVIRAIDNKTVILVGTPGWSSLGVSDGRTSKDITDAPLTFSNIMYTFHFYAASHKDEYYNELDKASTVLPIFVTEFGTQTYTGDGGNDFTMSDKYLQLLAKKKIGWTNWNYSDDSRSGAVWKTGTCSNGPWSDTNLKPAGIYIKSNIQK